MESFVKDKASFCHLTNVDPNKLQDLETVLTTILALPIARDTFAQVIEGRPTRTPYSDEIKKSKDPFEKTIIIGDSVKPNHEAVQRFEEIRAAFKPQELTMDLKLAQKYQDAQQGSREYLLRLLEIAAASVHALASSLYASSHKDMELNPPEPPGGHSLRFHRTDGYYVEFYHTNYKLFENYPFHLLNVVGYWAEAEIFGGVVLFEHEGALGTTEAFLHPQKTRQAFQLSDKQLQSFADLSRPGNVARSIRAETFLPFAQEPAARTEPTFARVGDPPLRIYKNKYDQPPVSHELQLPSCVIRYEGRAKSVREAMGEGWADQRSAHYFGAPKTSPSTEKNASMSKEDQSSVETKDP